MKRISRNLALAALLPLALAACKGGSGGTPVVATPPPTTTPTSTAFQDKFGTAFSADFNASTTATPAEPAAGDVPALNLTAEPIDG